MSSDPYYLIQKKLKENKISINDFADQLHLSKKDTKRIINSEKEIDDIIAEKLECCFGITYFDWLKMENEFRTSRTKEYIVFDCFAFLLGLFILFIFTIIFPIIFSLYQKDIILSIFNILYLIYISLDMVENIIDLKKLRKDKII